MAAAGISVPSETPGHWTFFFFNNEKKGKGILET